MVELDERFWSKVNKNGPNGCWVWMAYKNPAGYGQFQMWSMRKAMLAHRLAYENSVGSIPDGKVLDHICHNPACVNPDHLRICSVAQNSYNSLRPRTNKSGFKGVCYCKQTGLWKAYITLGGKQHWLGRFKTPEEAHAAYCNTAIRLHGMYANFGYAPMAGSTST